MAGDEQISEKKVRVILSLNASCCRQDTLGPFALGPRVAASVEPEAREDGQGQLRENRRDAAALGAIYRLLKARLEV